MFGRIHKTRRLSRNGLLSYESVLLLSHPLVQLVGNPARTVGFIPDPFVYQHETVSIQVERSKGAKNSAKRAKST